MATLDQQQQQQQQHRQQRSRQGSSATEKFYYPAPRRRRGLSAASTTMTSTNASLHSSAGGPPVPTVRSALSQAPSLQSGSNISSKGPGSGQGQGQQQNQQQRPFPLTPPRRRKKTVTEPPVVLNNVVHNMTSLERLRMMTQSLNNAAGSEFVPPPPSSSGSVYSLAPSTRSGSGSGQQFTVASVGSNGMMYLRPVQRQFQDPFVASPTTPPQTADQKQSLSELREAPDEGRENPIPNLNIIAAVPPPIPASTERSSSIHTPRTPKTSTPPESPNWQAPLKAPPSSPPIPKLTQHRARSLSIVGDHAKPGNEKSDGIPSRPVTEKFEPPPRPRTAGPTDAPILLAPVHLDVPIPRGTLGSPSFSASGTPFIIGSSLPPPSNLTEGRKTSSWDNMYTDLKLPWLSTNDRKKPPPTASGISSVITTALPSPALQPSEPIMVGGLQNIQPSIYDKLTFTPYCDDPSIVRYEARTREITAATPPRIIAQITSAAFLDYQFMSDFFLTFRAFMTPHDLLLYLMARLRWAIDRGDEIGKVVRVRTFVAIRHWLLNYFADDYVPSIELREKFTAVLNQLSDDVFIRPGADKSNMNILAELKKCWRKAAVLYWDGILGGINDHEVAIDTHITPGGAAGTREDPKSLKAAFEEDWSRRKGKGRARDSKSSIRRLPDSSAFAFGATQRLIRDIINAGPAEGPIPRQTLARAQDSTRMMHSRPKPRPASDSSSLYAYTGAQSSANPPSGPFNPTIPGQPSLSSSPSKTWKPLLHSAGRKGERVSSHKRSGSYNEPLRQNWHPPKAPKFLQGTSPHVASNFPNAGDLVRGNLKPPTTAVVEMMAPATPTEKSLAEMKIQNGKFKHAQRKGALSGPSVKRLFVNVKRALSGRAAPVHDKNIPPVPSHRRGPSEALARYVVEKGRNVTLTGILSRTESLASESPSASTRIDLLGAGVVEVFHNTLQAEIRMSNMTSLNGYGSDPNASKFTLTIGKALTTMQETPTPIEGKGKLFELDEPAGPSSSQEEEGELAITPKAKPRKFFRRASSSSAAESRKSTAKRKSSKDVIDDWNDKDILLPSSDSDVRRSKSFSFDLSAPSSDPPKKFEAGHHHQSSLESYDSAATGKFVQKGTALSGFGRTISGGIPEDFADDSIEDESVLSSPGPKSISSPFSRPPNRMLRRRPGGGDLKAAESIGDLGGHARQQSGATLETIETFSDSTMSIWQKHPETEMYQQPNGVLSLGAMTMAKPAAPMHHLRTETDEDDDDDDLGDEEGETDDNDDDSGDDDPSGSSDEGDTRENTFEAGVLKLAEMSDTMSDDGGIEVALAKLEGTYNRKQLERALSIHRQREAALQAEPLPTYAPDVQVHEQEIEASDESDIESARPSTLAPPEKKKQRQRQIIDNDTFTPLPSSGVNGVNMDEGRNSGFPFNFQQSAPSVVRESDGEDDDDVSNKENMPADPRLLSGTTDLLSVPDTIDDHNTLSLTDIQRELEGFAVQVSEKELDPDTMSDLSSEISFDMTSANKAPARPISISSSVLPGLQPSALLAEAGVPSHPMRHPPSPPLTLERAVTTSPDTEPDRLPTVDMSTIIPPETKVDPLAARYRSTHKLKKGAESGVHATAIHLPFILAYDSELLAKQFTLIEKDALTEIDWKELVELRWKPTSKPFRDWVEFLKHNDVRGVEIVVARFNLMVSWATSEIVMTRDIFERARCITKYIHIAAHARRLQNFATTYQLVIALLSADVARLKKTWSLVTEADRTTFRDLESLVQPNMNYHNLRREMDLVTGESGCIPFVGLFTHDLIHTATLTSQVAGTPNGPALVNWTKYKKTAQIVKKLLRLVDASAKYDFAPVDGVCERCLWMATLTKDEISSLSLEIEPPSGHDYR